MAGGCYDLASRNGDSLNDDDEDSGEQVIEGEARGRKAKRLWTSTL